jgi:transcriptional regulator GlxA family with amidase domain
MSDRVLRPCSTAPFGVPLAASANEVSAPDPYVDRAISAMKAGPARRWTVATLARAAGLSRAPFARRFRRATGTSPLRWLAAHRLGLAQSHLLAGDTTLAAIAAEVGYATEFALSKAFKRLFGIAPAGFRREAMRVSGAPRFRAAA